MEANPDQGRRKRLLSFLLKLAISSIALFFVFKKVQFRDTFEIIKGMDFAWFLAAIAAFNISKILSTERIRVLLHSLEIRISLAFNLKIYFIGAFYNIFLPGSVSGDIFKVFLLKEKYGKPVSKLVPVVLLDRITGIAALGFLTLPLFLLSSYSPRPSWLTSLAVTGMVLVFPILFVAMAKFFRTFKKAFAYTSLVSVISQLLQLVCAWCLLNSLGIDAHHWDYLALFMVASVVSILPISIGGLGAREWTFLFGESYLLILKEPAVAFSLLFFFVTAVSAFIGLFLLFGKVNTKTEIPSQQKN